MINLFNLKNTHKKNRRKKRVGRGIGSGKGKTCAKGHKGSKARAGAGKRVGYEGGQIRLFSKLPTRGFEGVRFKKDVLALNLGILDKLYQDGEVVNIKTLYEKGYVSKKSSVASLKILAEGELEKKVTIEASGFSKGALKKLEDKKIKFKFV